MAKPSFKGQFDRVTLTENDESEFKVGFFFKTELGKKYPSYINVDEQRIASVSEETWEAYKKHRYEYEATQMAQRDALILSDSSRIRSHHQEQNKERRQRSFYTMLDGHPKDIEIRTEIRDGEKITMVKKGNGASPKNPVIRRCELKLVSHIDEPIDHILRKLPKRFKERLAIKFNSKSTIAETMQTNSMRQKTKVRRIVETEKYGPLVFVLEPANDLGSGRTILDDAWPLREFECEVKGIYKPGSETDIKKNPEILGLSDKEMGDLCAEVLKDEYQDYLEFSSLYLLEHSREDPQRYGDIDVALICTSKSSPGLRLISSHLKKGVQAFTKLISHDSTGALRTFNW